MVADYSKRALQYHSMVEVEGQLSSTVVKLACEEKSRHDCADRDRGTADDDQAVSIMA